MHYWNLFNHIFNLNENLAPHCDQKKKYLHLHHVLFKDTIAGSGDSTVYFWIADAQ